MAEPASVAQIAIGAAWNLQGDPARAAFIDVASCRFGIALPLSPNTTTRGERLTAFWLGPRSWLLVAERPGAPFEDFDGQRDAVNAVGGALFDVSTSRVAFRVAGPYALAILAGGCPLDLHARAFPAGACAQSLFGHVNALVHKIDETPAFVVMVARSFGQDVSHALRDSAARYEVGAA